MDNSKLFKDILDSDETIIETFKPLKKRYVIVGLIKDFFIALFVGAFFFPVSLLAVAEESEESDILIAKILSYGLISLILLIIVFSMLKRLVSYKKIAYCYTNKRIIIRNGFIGVDYQMLDFDMIGAMNVRVDLLDKLFKPNTGTITFASAASPITTQNNGTTTFNAGYSFFCIENPYDVYRRIKEYSSNNKDGNFNS